MRTRRSKDDAVEQGRWCETVVGMRRAASSRPTNCVIARSMLYVAIWSTLTLAQTEPQREYNDAARRFRFSYPASFGEPSAGTNDGFNDRVAAIRFSGFSAALGGEAALTRGFPVIDMQAAGGLYDAISLEVFPDAIRRQILEALPPLSAATFCKQIALEQHINPQAAVFAKLTAQQRSALASADRMRNVSPRVVRCEVEGTTVTFDKEVSFVPGGPRQHVYGAVRFLDAPYSTFQIVRAGPAPDNAALSQMTMVVRSWTRY